jgi:hypothetical protein
MALPRHVRMHQVYDEGGLIEEGALVRLLQIVELFSSDAHNFAPTLCGRRLAYRFNVSSSICPVIFEISMSDKVLFSKNHEQPSCLKS